MYVTLYDERGKKILRKDYIEESTVAKTGTGNQFGSPITRIPFVELSNEIMVRVSSITD